jgi:hypothetical protein
MLDILTSNASRNELFKTFQTPAQGPQIRKGYSGLCVAGRHEYEHVLALSRTRMHVEISEQRRKYIRQPLTWFVNKDAQLGQNQ